MALMVLDPIVEEQLKAARDSPARIHAGRLANRQLELVNRSDQATSALLTSLVGPVSFRLIAAAPRPQIEVTHHDGAQRWMV